MKSALFSKLTLAALLTVGAMSACGGDATTGTGDGSQGACTAPFQTCTCPNGGPGYQTCQNGTLTACTCNGGGTGGTSFGNPPPGGSQVVGGSSPGGAVCGNGVIENGEQCDGQQQGGETCMTFTMGACTGGYLICTGTCTFDISACGPCTSGVGGSGATFGGGGFPGGGTTGQP